MGLADRHNDAMADRLGVRLLGEFRIDGVEVETLHSRQARTLLKRLAVEQGGTVSPDSLVEAVWPGSRPAQPARDLHVLVSRARTVVGADRVVRRDGGYALVADWWDVAELASLAREAARRSDDGDAVGARTAAEGALALVRGSLLADEADAEWAAEARSASDNSVAEVRRVAAAAALATGQVGDAAAHAAEALRSDPYDEAALRTLMRAHAAAGRPASALAEFARVRELLAEELGVDPAPETRVLHEELLREGPQPVTVPERAAALVGRVAELRVLDAELARSRGGARMVVVSGEPGVGKTALLDQWAITAAARGTVVLRGRAEQGELALQPVLDALAGCTWCAACGTPPSTQLRSSSTASPPGMSRRTTDSTVIGTLYQPDSSAATASAPAHSKRQCGTVASRRASSAQTAVVMPRPSLISARRRSTGWVSVVMALIVGRPSCSRLATALRARSWG